MAKGVAGKGYKMTKNRIAILELLVEEGGGIRSSEGRATGLMHGLLPGAGSQVSLNASLREMENLGWISRHIDGRRTFEITITDAGREAIGAEPAEKSRGLKIVRTAAANVETDEAQAQVGPPADFNADEAAERIKAGAAEPVAPEQWDWDAEKTAVPGEIDYDILLGVFLKAALRGMEGPSNGELDYYKQQNELGVEKIQKLEAQVEKLRGEAASAIAERDQLQKNLNIIMSKSESKRTRGSDPVRNLLSPDERAALDALMRQVPTHKGD